MTGFELDRWRELWLLALGASLVDKDVRAQVVALPDPPLGWVKVLKAALKDGDAEKGWHALKEGWGVERGERSIDMILDRVERLPLLSRKMRLLEEWGDCRAMGDTEGADLAEAKLKELIRNGKA